LTGTANMIIKAMVVSGLAAFFAYMINRVMVSVSGDGAIKLLVPIVEEGLKTGLALAFTVSLPIVHMSFGIYEAIYDILANPGVGRSKRWLAAVLAFSGHSIFGWLTWVFLDLGLASVFAIVLVGIVHGCWNIAALAK
jgi:hypothetical protein